MYQRFIDNLSVLDFVTEPQGYGSLLLTSQINEQDLPPNELFALEAAIGFKADAVYFRRFADDRPAIPQIYLYDNTDNKFADNDLANIHRDLWSNCYIPMFVEIGATYIAVFDARKPVEVLANGEIRNESIGGRINIASAVKFFSRTLFDSGIFWESEKAKGHFLESTSAYRDLIANLKYIRDEFVKTASLPTKTAHRLIVFAVLVKYLEERGNENKNLFARNFFQGFGAEDFCGVLRKRGEIVKLFDELSQHFNGKIFEWADKEERSNVGKADLSSLAYFLSAEFELSTGQGYLWPKYAFNHLPVELISSVYEILLNERKDAVYTPEFLVNTLVDEAIPQKEFEKKSVRTIDVSCGSGIFLVSVFKRLARRHRYAEFKRTKQLKPLTSKTLLKIIKDNIFGVDIEADAVRLTVFSLCLALCDELTPKKIWTELKFDDTFQTNFKSEDFFEFLNNSNLASFDLVIGNPPFAELEIKTDLYKRILELNEEIKLRAKQKLFPYNQLALMFLDQTPRLLKENGLLCLIMPAAPLLYNNSAEFRKHFFPKHQVLRILDFTNLDAVLFEADVPTAALIARKQDHDHKQPVTHIAIRRTRSAEQKLFFEVDKYDFHYVSQLEALSNKHVWKCNLIGGGRLNNLIDRLSKVKSISDFVEENKWASGVGYVVGTANDKNKKPADFISQKPTLPTRAFTEQGVDFDQVIPESATLFHSTGDEKIYQPPHLLIKANIGKNKIPTYFSDDYLTFRHRIIGVACPADQREQLLDLYNSFDTNREIYRLFIAATSNEYLVGRATSILAQDIANLPYSADKNDLKFSLLEQIICDDVLNFQIEMLAKGSRARANLQNAISGDLESYAEIFSKLLNSIYGKSDKYFFLRKIQDWGGFFVTEFDYGVNTNPLEFETIAEPDDNLKSLIRTEYGTNAFLIKVLKIYEKNKVYLIKPKALRYWLRSIAIIDADEVFSDLIKAGY